MRDKRVLITGGAGLVGSHIADLLVQEGAREIVVLDNFVRGTMDNLAGAIGHGCVTVLHGDIRDPGEVAGAMEGIDVVFHQAAIRITQCAEDPRLALDVLATGSFNVFEAAAKAGVQKVVAASSASVLGMADAFPTTERHHPYNNRTIYGAAKTFNEGLLASFAEMYGLRYVALRYFNIYGPRMDVFGVYTEVLIRWMERLARGEAPIIFGDGSQTMDFVNVLDVARANLLAAKADVTDTVFNVASGTETSLKELAQLLAQVMEVPLGPDFAPERKVNPVPRRLADTTRAQAELGFSATISLEEGLRELVAWWRQAQLRKGVVA
ncbi:MAG: NAD-dependent epimerase/dehydratase family protein [Devosia sp.]|uniref:NAD-dependent epimerase/dehydratase family protein n=1 Tax=Devosia sp. TaxID=1871048 RepID=UPI00339849CD